MSTNYFLQFKKAHETQHLKKIQQIFMSSPLRMAGSKESSTTLTYASFADFQGKISNPHEFNNVLDVIGLNQARNKVRPASREALNHRNRRKITRNSIDVKRVYRQLGNRSSLSPSTLKGVERARKVSPLRAAKAKPISIAKKIQVD